MGMGEGTTVTKGETMGTRGEIKTIGVAVGTKNVDQAQATMTIARFRLTLPNHASLRRICTRVVVGMGEEEVGRLVEWVTRIGLRVGVHSGKP